MSTTGWYEDVLSERYDLLDTFASAPTSATLLVHDRQTGSDRVLKLRCREDEESWKSLNEEFEALVKLSHPRLVRPFEIEHLARGRVAALALEYVAGINARRLVGRLSLPQALRLGSSVAEGLVYLHRRERTHGDIKPENLLLPSPDLEAPQGTALDAALAQLKITDFGLSGLSGEHARGGTPGFIPPEVARGAVATTAADVFEFGVLLWEVVTGKQIPESRAADPLDAARRFRATAPSHVRPDLDPGVDAVVLKALAADPERRPSVETLLTDIDGLLEDTGGKKPSRGALKVMVGPWVERHDVRGELDRAIERSGAVILEGPAEAGKTVILDWLARSLLRRGRRVMRIDAHWGDRSVEPFARLGGVSRSELGVEMAHPSVSDSGFDLERERRKAVEAQASADDELVRRFAAGCQPGTVVIVDDADRLTAGGQQLLRRLVVEESYAPAKIVIGTRPIEDQGLHHPALLALEPGVEVVTVPALTELEVAASLLTDFEPGYRTDLVEWLVERSASIPGRVPALLDQAAEQGAIARGEHGFTVQRSLLEQLPALPSSTASVELSLAKLGCEARQVADALAILGGLASRPALAQLIGLEGDALGDALVELFVLRLCKIAADGATIAFGPGVDGRAVRALIGAEMARELHRRAATIVDDPRRRVEHERLGELREAQARTLLDLARNSLDSGDAHAAVSYYQEALDNHEALPASELTRALDEAVSVASSVAHMQLLIGAGRLLINRLAAGARRVRVTSRVAQALLNEPGGTAAGLALLREARGGADTLDDPALDGEVYLHQAWGVHVDRHSDRGLADEYLRKALDIALSIGDRELERRVYNRMGALYQTWRRFQDAEAAYRKALALAEESGDQALALVVRINLTAVRDQTGSARATRDLVALLKESQDLMQLDSIARITRQLAFAALAAGEFEKARVRLHEGLSVARRMRSPKHELLCLWGLAYAERQTGSLRITARLYRQAIHIARQIGDHERECEMLGNLADVERLIGHTSEAGQLIDRALGLNLRAAEVRHAAPVDASASASRVAPWDSAARSACARILSAAGEHGRARATLAPALRHAREQKVRNIASLYRLCDAADIEIEAGELAAAAELERECTEVAARLNSPFASAPVARLAARLRVLEDETLAVGATFSAAVREYRQAMLIPDLHFLYVEIAELLVVRARESDRRDLWQEAAKYLDLAGQDVDRVGASGDRIRDLTLEVLGKLRDLGDGFATSARDLLNRMYEVLNSLQNVDELLDHTLRLVVEIVGADRGLLVLRNPKTSRYEVGATHGMPRRAQTKALAVSRSVIREVMRSGTRIAAENTGANLDLKDRESIQLHRIGGLACTPLLVGERVIGAVYVDCLHRNVEFLPGSERLMSNIAACVALAIHNARVQAEQAQAHTRLLDRNLELAREIGASESRSQLVGSSALIRDLREKTQRIAAADGPFLVVGPSGTGKEHVAQGLHAWSDRRRSPFLAAALTTVSASLVPATLFGVAKAVATGVDERAGLFEQVGEGTLFLDEITEVSCDMQAALLRVIEQRVFSRAGEEGKTIQFRGRLVFASNRDPERAIRDGVLREDLYFRISTYVLETPPLASHRSDIPELIAHFRELEWRRTQRRGVEPPYEFVEACTREAWPGNVRELRNLVTRAETTARRTEDWMVAFREHVARRPGHVPLPSPGGYAERLREFERSELIKALRSVEWNQAAAARLLSLPEATLRYKVKTLGIELAEAGRSGST